MRLSSFIAFWYCVLLFLCQLPAAFGQSNNHIPMPTPPRPTANPLLCEPATGVCEVPHTATTTDGERQPTRSTPKPIKVLYFTDPICSSCWGIEPQLRKLKLEYGDVLEFDYRMGGLLPDWSYNSGGISKPTDVAPHWDEVSRHYDMPIDGDVWLEDPLPSSYPPSIAFKAAQRQDPAKAISFLRALREMVFLEKKNIAKWEHIATAARAVGLQDTLLKTDMEGVGKATFQEDLQLARQYGVRGFPTVFFIAADAQPQMVYGTRPYSFYEVAVLTLQPTARKAEYARDSDALFARYPTLTAKEFAELSGVPRATAESVLDAGVAEGTLTKYITKNGAIWRRR